MANDDTDHPDRTAAGAPPAPVEMTVDQALDVALQHHKAGRLAEAENIYRQILTAAPDHHAALHLLGVIAHQAGDHGQAVELISKALAAAPNFAEAHCDLGNALKALGKAEEAMESHRRAIALNPEYELAHYNLGNALLDLGRFEDAADSFQKAVDLNPDFAQAHNNLGNMLAELGRYGEAETMFQKALALAPGYADAEFKYGVLLLLKGNYEEGWKKYEHRLSPEFTVGLRPRDYAQPRWDGGDLAGKTLFLYVEQGFGDAIQFVRFVKPLAAKAERIVLECRAELMELLSTAEGLDAVIDRDASPPEFDVHAPLLSLPHLLGTTVDNIPADVPYLKATEDRIEQWRERLGEGGFKVGINWQGNPSYMADHFRSIALRLFEPVANIPDVRLISLQKSHGLDQLENLPPGMTIETLGDDFDEGPDAFKDTAAVMMSLDLIITSDTSIAHLGGALARPVWTLLPHVPDWRWMLDRDDSPWYPGMRLFRQPASGEWESVFERIREELLSD